MFAKRTHITGNVTIHYMELQYVLSILNIIVAYIVCMIVASEVYKWPACLYQLND